LAEKIYRNKRVVSSSDNYNYDGREQYKQGVVDGMNKALEYGIKLKPKEKKEALMAARFARSRKMNPVDVHKRMKTDRKFNRLVKTHKKLGFL